MDSARRFSLKPRSIRSGVKLSWTYWSKHAAPARVDKWGRIAGEGNVKGALENVMPSSFLRW